MRNIEHSLATVPGALPSVPPYPASSTDSAKFRLLRREHNHNLSFYLFSAVAVREDSRGAPPARLAHGARFNSLPGDNVL